MWHDESRLNNIMNHCLKAQHYVTSCRYVLYNIYSTCYIIVILGLTSIIVTI